MKYELPPSQSVNPWVHKHLKGELIITFGAGPLIGMTYRPVGLDALWSLIGAVASLEEPFHFKIKPSLAETGIQGGFDGRSFCLLDVTGDPGEIEVFSTSKLTLPGASQVTDTDHTHDGLFFWVPDCAMMSFADLIRVGNAVLLSEKTYVSTRVGQAYANWVDGRYVPS